MMKAVSDFWNEADTEELLKMSETDIVAKLQQIMRAYSTAISRLRFPRMM